MGKHSGYCEERVEKLLFAVIPAKAGIPKHLKPMDSRLRGNDGKVDILHLSKPSKAGTPFRSHPSLGAKPRSPRGSPGFSLVELAIVMVIISIVAVAGVPMVGPLVSQAKLAGAAEEVVTALEYAQLIAMTTGMKTRVAVSYTYNTIYVRRYHPSADLFGGGDQLSETDVETETYTYMQYPLKRGSDYVIDLSVDERFQGVKITASDLNILAAVYFDALGSPSKGGSATLALGKRQKVVTLDALTGKVTVSD
jgi:prepilin-type N-terminal cleavage/methylation domain-containing protein